MGKLTIAIVPLNPFRKVYKIATPGNDNKFWAFKKITYSKDSEGVFNIHLTFI